MPALPLREPAQGEALGNAVPLRGMPRGNNSAAQKRGPSMMIGETVQTPIGPAVIVEIIDERSFRVKYDDAPYDALVWHLPSITRLDADERSLFRD